MGDRVSQIEIEKLYQSQLKSGKSWEEIVREVALNSIELAEQLVEYRDILDYRLYLDIVEILFPKDFFEVRGERDGSVEQQDGHLKYKQGWYVFKIYDSGLTRPAVHDENCCIVKINAPGSRNLTSDIDTTVTVIGAERLKEDNFSAWLLGRGPDYNGRIANQIIKEFNERRLQTYRVTSATALDSNVYAEGFLGDHIRFNWSEVKRSLGIPATEILPFERDERFFVEFKRIKHIQEQAASLFLLHEALTVEDWEEFTSKVKSAIVEEFTENRQRGELVNQEFTAAETSLAEIYKLRTDMLKEKKAALQVKSVVETELEIAAMNELYFECLEEVTTCNGEIMSFPRMIKELLEQLKSQEQQRTLEEESLEEFKANPKLLRHIPGQEKVCSENTRAIEETKEKLRKLLLGWAGLQNRKQYLQIMANTFAIEAYSNWGAPYHVVRGIQEKQPIILSKQAIMGSCLQQVGFRLIHSKQLRQKQVSDAEIALKVAKYGQRIADLIFGRNEAGRYVVVNKAYSDVTLLAAISPKRDNSLNILARFNSEMLANGHAYFIEPEYLLLNSEIAIVEVKGDTKLTTKEKLKKVVEILALRPFKLEEEQKLFLSIASKLIAAAYTAKLNKPRSVTSSASEMAPASTSSVLMPCQAPSAGLPVTPLADSQRSRLNARGAVVSEGGIRQVNMGDGPVVLDVSYAQTRDTIEQVHTGGASSEQIGAVGRLLGHLPSPK